MATLRFSFGTMGSGKSTLALQIHHNLSTRQLFGLLLTSSTGRDAGDEPARGRRTGDRGRPPTLDLHALAVRNWPLHYLVCDEVQFYTVDAVRPAGARSSTTSRSTCTPSG